MGEEIGRTRFTPADLTRFNERLALETQCLEAWFRDGVFSESGYSWGFEVESWLLDHDYFPNPANEVFLNKLRHPLVVHELSRFNVELNTPPLDFSLDTFQRADRQLRELWEHCNRVAHGLDANMLLIGTLPAIRQSDLTLANISAVKRYQALNSEVLRAREGRPFELDIQGRDHLHRVHEDVMLEAGTTSFQIHLKTPARLAHRYYNASLMAAGPVLAVCGNSPFLFGHDLWAETRIPLFEQSIGLGGRLPDSERVGFGRGYIGSVMELFRENREEYPALLPLGFDEPLEALRHLRLHNGTIWRWIRPLIGFEEDGQPHLRLEFRCLPAGPSLTDMVANAALFLGLVHGWVMQDVDTSGLLPFADARANFYAAARDGMDAPLRWAGKDGMPVRRLWLDELLPMARSGLREFGIGSVDIHRYLDVIASRIESGVTGAVWQRQALKCCGGDIPRFMAAYAECQRSAAPVHQWPLPSGG